MRTLFLFLLFSLFSFKTFADQKKCDLILSTDKIKLTKTDLSNFKCKEGDRAYSLFVRDVNDKRDRVVESNLHFFAHHNCDHNKQILINIDPEQRKGDMGSVSCILKLLDRR